MNRIKTNWLLGILVAATLSAPGCAMDTAPDSQLEGPPVSDSMPASTSCAAACRTLLGGCFEPIERDVLAACREDCEVSGLGGFDVECLAELGCETSVEICAGDEAQ